MKLIIIILFFWAFLVNPVLASEVLSVGDGDTITVTKNGQKTKVRLACIDAPESKQEGGQASTNRLKQLLPVGTQVNLDEVDTDRFGRTVAIVFKESLNINLTMVQEGQAVIYPQYLSYCPDSQRFIDAQNQAKKRGIGFWAIDGALMPWQYRQGKPPTASRSQPYNLPSCVQEDCDCKDFRTQAQAQQVLDAFPGDPYRLDGDKDGVACESLP